MKFKVGDRVKLIVKDTKYMNKIGTITFINSDIKVPWRYHVRVDGEEQSLLFSKIEVVEDRVDKQSKLKGKKNDEGKPQMGLVSTIFIKAIAIILTSGVQKYGAHNWREGMVWSRPYDALQRHLVDWWDGKDYDKESGRSHLWHAACELMFLVEYEAKGLGKDDRWKGE